MIISCKNIVKDFTDGTKNIRVLDHINFDLKEGETVAIVGPSGSGKSTLLHVLAGLDYPTEGHVSAFGEDLATINENKLCKLRNEKFGFVYQHHHLLKDFSVIENVMLPMQIKGLDRKTSHSRSLELLKLVQLDDRTNFPISSLSGGQKQRVAILRAFANKPDCILADEPTGNLCHATAMSVYNSFLDLNAEFNMAVVTVTHDRELAAKMSKIYHLEDGKLIRE